VSSTAVAWQITLSAPWRLPTTRWPWRAVRYLLRGVVRGIAWLPVVLVLLAVGLVLTPIGVGVSVLTATFRLGSRFAAADRQRLGLTDPRDVRPVRQGPRWRPRYGSRQRGTWREFGYLLLAVSVTWVLEAVVTLVPLFVIGSLLVAPVLVFALGDQLVVGGPPLRSLPVWPYLPLFGLGLFVVFSYVWVGAAKARAALVRGLTGPRRQPFSAQLVELGRSRERLLDAFDVERKRIERDLHDGAQQRLVSLTMTLGLAKVELEDADRDGTATRLVTEAHRDAKQVLTELRELIRGIRPQVLTDRGLVAAVDELADQAALTVRSDIQLPGRPPERIESTVYFVVSEALSNAGKHGNARRVDISGRVLDDTLVVAVSDDGDGGADPACGTGLQGLVDRVATVGGKLLLASPTGGPTVVRVEIPWPRSR
jgi:signal transduction histidine kinase